MTMYLTLHSALQRLAERRRDAQAAKAAVEKQAEIVKETPEGQILQTMTAKLCTLNAEVEELEQQVRGLTLRIYEEHQDKTPAPGGAWVKLFREVRYEAQQLLEWCQAHRPTYVMLSLDTKRVNKSADDLILDGAPLEIVQAPRAQIATDLSRFAAAGEGDALADYLASLTTDEAAVGVTGPEF